MMKLKRIFVIFGVLLIIFTFVGCNQADKAPINDKKETPIDVEGERNGVDQPNKTFLDNIEGSRDNKIEFSADTYIQHPALSWVYSLDVTMEDGHIYLNEILYDTVSYEETNDLLLGDAFMAFANSDQEISATLEKIKSCKGRYIIKTSNEHARCGEKIAVYDIDGSYYFLSFFEENGYVMRIHKASIT
jgi:hypothetical protein